MIGIKNIVAKWQPPNISGIAISYSISSS